jgi:hypothetical protein
MRLPAVGARASRGRRALLLGLIALPLPLPLPLPSVNLPLPSVNLSLPSVSLPVPGVEVTVPSTTVTVPSVGVSVGPVSTTTPEVSVGSPSVSTSTEQPAGSSPPSGGEGGGGGAPAGGSHGSSGSGSSGGGGQGGVVYAPAAGPNTSGGGASTASTSALDAGAATAQSGASTHQDGALGGRRRAPARSQRRHSPRAALAGAPGAPGAIAPAGSPAASTGASVHRSEAGNPLDTIGKHLPLPIPVPNWSKPIILLLLALALWFAVRSRVEARRARRLERQHATLLRDVDAMQRALVPQVPARVGGLGVSVGYRPADGPAAGGDFYDVFVPERGKVAVILGDVAGHGHGALTQAALTRYTLRAYLQTGMEPRSALALAGRVLARANAEHFATVVVGIYNTHDGCLTFAGAGHPPPILHGLQTRQPLRVCASPPIGWTVPTGRRQTTVSLPPGAVVCFFSDGLVEARCRDDLLGWERLSEMLGELGARPNASKLLARVRSVAQATPDDMAACILVPEMAVVGEAVHVEELEVDAKALGNGFARRFLETCELPGAELEQTLARAADMVSALGASLLRVQLTAKAPAKASISAPPPAPQAPTIDRRPQRVGTP